MARPSTARPSAARRVLGVDLAVRRWRDNGTALLEFDRDGWRSCDVGVLGWPDRTPDAVRAAQVIDDFVTADDVHAVCLDGGFAWRDPDRDGPGVGRLAEKALHAQSKTGAFGICYPRTQARWVHHCIDLVTELLATGRYALVDDHDGAAAATAAGRVLLVESFPTATWRASAETPLPSKAKAPDPVVRLHAQRAEVRFGLPAECLVPADHDGLQAVIAALAGVGLLGGPAVAHDHGLPVGHHPGDPAQGVPPHRVEGKVWTASPRLG